MKLLILSLRNFMGLENFNLELEGRSASVFGTNAAGKTTLFSAWNWLFFGKNSKGEAAFDIKTLTPDGEPHRGLDHEVEAALELADGRRLTLRRVYREQWTKRRGEARKEFTGHTTEFYVDDVPVKKSDYEAQVADKLAPEETFRLLTDPEEFPERLPWKRRREILLEIAGDVTDADIIAEDERFAELGRVIAERSLADQREVIRARKKKVNAELEDLPIRIDEVTQGLPDLPEGLTDVAAEDRVADLRAERQAAEQERQRIESGGEVAKKTRELREVEAELLAARTRLTAEQEEREAELRSKESRARGALDDARRKARAARAESREAAEELETLERRMAAERERFERVNAEEFCHEEPDTCAACGQKLPADKVEAAREKALATFNEDKARRLEAIREEGQRLKAKRDELFEGAEARDSAVAAADAEVERLEGEATKAQAALEGARGNAPEPSADTDYARLDARKVELEAEITSLREGNEEALAASTARIDALDGQVRGAQAQLALFAHRRQGESRIEDLLGQEERLAEEFERLEHQLHLIDECEREKARLLDERVAEHFEMARFKLFRELINGGLEPCCETTYGGVPYSSGLNHGARIAVGLDIIRTLQRHWGFAPPTWVDQAESFASLPTMDSQVIRLAVSAEDKQLRVKTETETGS